MIAPLFSNPPTVTVLDNYRLPVRELQYCCHPDAPTVTAELITRHQYDARGFLTQSADPRLQLTYRNALTGAVIRKDSADAGTSLILAETSWGTALSGSLCQHPTSSLYINLCNYAGYSARRASRQNA